MKKQIIVLALIFGLGGAGWIYWNQQTNETHQYEGTPPIVMQKEQAKVGEQAKDNVKEEREKIKEVAAPSNDNREEVKDKENPKSDKKEQISNNVSKVQKSEPPKTQEPKSEPEPVGTKQVIVEPLSLEEREKEIVTRYTSKFTSLKIEFEGKISAMISEAKKEYLALSEEERKKQKYALGLKYLKKASDLEKQCDQRFKLILEQMQKELKDNQLPTDSIKKAEQQYKEEKSARRKALMDKVLSKQ